MSNSAKFHDNPLHEHTLYQPKLGPYRAANCIIEWVEDAASKFPNNIAIVEDRTGRSFTYTELMQKVDSVAKVLTKTIKYPDVNIGDKTPLVAILTERSLASIVGILGILKANAAYVPVDPSFPDDRQAHIFSHSKCQLALVDDANRHRVDNVRSAVPQVFMLSNDTGLIESDSVKFETNNAPTYCVPVCPESLSYVLYTSGSTGKPKGVMVKNKGLLNVVDYFVHLLKMNAQDHVLGLTTFCFDISMLEIFMPLITGASLYVVTSATQKNPMKILDVVTAQHITIMQATPTTYEMLIACGWSGDQTMRFLVGGEACRPKVATLAATCGPFYNVYGPTETSIWSSSYQLPLDSSELANGVPVGGPISATSFYVVNEQGQDISHIPDGEGELWIGGDGVALGYLHAPDLTVQRFLKNPFGPGEVYRTGDLFKRRASDNNFIFVRRLDDQVKVNGYRIELGEVEIAIAKHPDIDQVIVIVKDDALVAFVKLKIGYVAKLKDPIMLRTILQQQAKQSLPPYMVPKKIFALDDFPKTPNGKMDKLLMGKMVPDLEATIAEQEPVDIEEGPCDTNHKTTPLDEGANKDTLELFVLKSVNKMSGRTPSPNSSFASVGIDSLAAMMYRNTLSQSLGGVNIDPNILFDPDTTIRSFSNILFKTLEKEKPGVLTKLGITRATGNDTDGEIIKDPNDPENQAVGYVLLQKRKIIEGLRGVTTVLVLIDHFYYSSSIGGYRIHCDTVLFLIITGFTMALQDITLQEEIEEKKKMGTIIHPEDVWDPWGFLYSRFVGLFPLYWLVMICHIPTLYVYYPNDDGFSMTESEYAGLMVLYILGLQTWTLWSNRVMHDVYYVSLVWGVLIMYATFKSIHVYIHNQWMKWIGFACTIAFLIGMYAYNSDGGFHPPIGTGYFALGYVFAILFAYMHKHSIQQCTQLLEVTAASMQTKNKPLDEEAKLAERQGLTAATTTTTTTMNDVEMQTLSGNEIPPPQSFAAFEGRNTSIFARFSLVAGRQRFLNWKARMARILPSVWIDVFAFLFLFLIFFNDYGVPMSSSAYKAYDKFMLLFGTPLLFSCLLLSCFLQPKNYQYSLFYWVCTETKLLILLGECSLAIYIIQLMFMQYFNLAINGIMLNAYPYTRTFAKHYDNDNTHKFWALQLLGIGIAIGIGIFLQKVYQERFIAYLHLKVMDWWSKKKKDFVFLKQTADL